MDYPCDKFGDRSFSRLDFIMPTDAHADIHTQRVGVSNNNK